MKYALVTGGSRGIGRAISVALAQKGYPILINYVSNDSAAQETLKLVKAEGVEAELLKFDVSDNASVVSHLEAWQSVHENDYIAVLVNNAGIRDDAVMALMEDEQWRRVLHTNLDSFFYVTRWVIRSMMMKRWGRVINMASLSGLKGMPGQTNYSAAKGGLIATTKALAQEVAPRKVTVNAIAPGFIATDMVEGLPVEELSKNIPMKRFGKPKEVAAVAAFLASDEASYVTGNVISVNGGLYT